LGGGAFLMAAPYWRGPVEQALVNLLTNIDWRLFTTVFLAVALALILFGRRVFRRAES
jgi:membrane protein implicated in regulation of membrane protease activity